MLAYEWGKQVGRWRLGRRLPRVLATVLTLRMALNQRFAFVIGMDSAIADAARTPVVSTYEFGRAVGRSRVGRRFPRLVQGVDRTALPSDLRKAFGLGTKTARVGYVEPTQLRPTS